MNSLGKILEKSSVTKKIKERAILPWALSALMAFSTPTIYSCGGGGGSEEGENNPKKEEVIAKGTHVLNDSTIQELESYDDGVLTFSQDTNQLQNLYLGDIIIGKVNNKTPKGFLRRITNTYLSSSSKVLSATPKVVVETEPCALEELVKKGRIESSELDNKTFNISTDIDKVLYDGDGDLLTENDQIKLTGSLSLGLDILFSAEFEGGLKNLSFEKEIQGKLSLDLTSSASAYNLDKRTTIYTKNLGTYTVVVGGIPIVLTPELKVNIGVKGDFPSGINASVTQDLTSASGVSYDGVNWRVIKDSSSFFNFDINSIPVNTTPNPPKIYAGLELEFFLYDSIGPYGEINGYSKIEIDIAKDPWWVLYGGLDAVFGVKMDVIDSLKKEYPPTQVNLINKVLTQSKTLPLPQEKLLLVSNKDGNYNIYEFDILNSEFKKLTNLANMAINGMRLSPDESQIAFSAYQGSGDGNIYTMNRDGQNLTRITFSGDNTNPEWSPSGDQIAYEKTIIIQGKGTLNVNLINSDGTNNRKLIDNPSIENSRNPVFDPSTGRIVFVSYSNSKKDGIFSIKPDGTGLETLIDGSFYDRDPSFSKSGTMLFSSNPDGNDLEIYSKDKGTIKMLTDNSEQDYRPKSNGSYIVFIKEEGSGFFINRNLWAMNTNGTGKKLITPNADHATFHPDKKTLFYVKNRDIYRKNLDGTGEENLTNLPSDEYNPIFIPK